MDMSCLTYGQKQDLSNGIDVTTWGKM